MNNILIDIGLGVVAVLVAPFAIQAVFQSKTHIGKSIQLAIGVGVVTVFLWVWGNTGRDPLQWAYCWFNREATSCKGIDWSTNRVAAVPPDTESKGSDSVMLASAPASTPKLLINPGDTTPKTPEQASAGLPSLPNPEPSRDAVDLDSTNGSDFSRCVDAGKCERPSYDEFNRDPATGGNEPAQSITWYMARDYCRWIGKRLPTLEEYKTSWKSLRWRGCCARGVIPREWVSDTSNAGESVGIQVRATTSRLDVLTLNKSKAYDSTTVRCATER